eukprot:UN12231
MSYSSLYTGVAWIPRSKLWKANFTHNGNTYFVGTYISELKAAESINAKCKEVGKPPLNPTVACVYHEPSGKVRKRKSLERTVDAKSILSINGVYRGQEIKPSQPKLGTLRNNSVTAIPPPSLPYLKPAKKQSSNPTMATKK